MKYDWVDAMLVIIHYQLIGGQHTCLVSKYLLFASFPLTLCCVSKGNVCSMIMCFRHAGGNIVVLIKLKLSGTFSFKKVD